MMSWGTVRVLLNNTVHYIYCHTSPNGKRYIGQTGRNPESRWLNGWGYCKQPYFFKAIQKYGWENFDHKILTVCCHQSTADYLEQHYIKTFETFNRDKGYNLTTGGGGAPSYVVSDEMKAHLRKLAKERGITQEHIKKMYEAKKAKGFKGRKLSEAEKKHLSELHKGPNNWIYGKTHSSETKAKMSASRKGKKRSKETCRRMSKSLRASEKIAAKCKAVLQHDADGNLVARHASMADAARSIGASKSEILSVCAGKKDTARGYVWTYEDVKLRAKADERRAERKSKPSSKKAVVQLSLDGEVLGEFESILSASKATGCFDTGIHDVCAGKQDTTNGYRWVFKDESLRAKAELVATERHKRACKNKAVVQFDRDGNYVAEYPSLSDAANATGFAISNISASCRKENRRTAGYKWRFKSELPDSLVTTGPTRGFFVREI